LPLASKTNEKGAAAAGISAHFAGKAGLAPILRICSEKFWNF